MQVVAAKYDPMQDPRDDVALGVGLVSARQRSNEAMVQMSESSAGSDTCVS